MYTYKASRLFWHKFHALPIDQKEAARRAWRIFRVDPFDPRLGTHRIHRLSALQKRTVYSIVITGNLRAVFYIDGDTVFTFDLGTHAIYR